MYDEKKAYTLFFLNDEISLQIKPSNQVFKSVFTKPKRSRQA